MESSIRNLIRFCDQSLRPLKQIHFIDATVADPYINRQPFDAYDNWTVCQSNELSEAMAMLLQSLIAALPALKRLEVTTTAEPDVPAENAIPSSAPQTVPPGEPSSRSQEDSPHEDDIGDEPRHTEGTDDRHEASLARACASGADPVSLLLLSKERRPPQKRGRPRGTKATAPLSGGGKKNQTSARPDEPQKPQT